MWEYKAVDTDCGMHADSLPDKIEEILNENSAKGFSLVQVVVVGDRTLVVLKRERIKTSTGML